jgi:hypothetical protein
MGLRAPLMVFCTPAVKDRFESVSSGPRTYPFSGPNCVGSYCLTNPFLIADKFRLLPSPNPPKKVLEPGVVADE